MRKWFSWNLPDGEKEWEELPQGDHQGDGKAGALGGEDEDCGDAEVLREDVADQVEQHAGNERDDGERRRGHDDVPVVEDVWGQQEKSG